MSDTVLRTRNVRKEYKAGESSLTVLKGVSLEVNEGEILAIVGPSGAGKSTLLHIMGFLDRPTGGEVLYGDTSLTELTSREQAAIRNRNFGFVFQLYHLLPDLTALENVVMPLMVRHSIPDWLGRRKQALERARGVLDRLGLGRRMEHRPSELSGGEQQRLAIGRAIVGEPRMVMCDEPTGSLDSDTAQEIRELIVELNKETGKTFVIVTHDQRTAELAHRCLRIEDGELVKPEKPA